MSGDVQPRRRKDKRRKKEEDDIGTPPPNLVSPSADPTAENLTIHVHKEGGTGGHWCARIIFFSLLAILVGLIGVILIEHRGAADVDTPITESRWATVFDGWIDDVQVSHDKPKPVTKDNSHNDPEPTDEASEEASDEADPQENEAPGESKEEDTGEDVSNGNNETEGDDDEQELDSYQEPGESEEEQASIERKNKNLSEENEQEDSKEVENNYSEENFQQADSENDDDGEDDDDDDGNDENAALEEVEENTSGEELQPIESKEDDLINDSDNELATSIEGVDATEGKFNGDDDKTDDDDVSSEFLGIPGVNEIDEDSAEPLEEVDDEEPEEIPNELEIEPVVEEVEEESSSGIKPIRAAPTTSSAERKSESRPVSSREKPATNPGGARDYEHHDITNSEDALIREELDIVQGETAEKRFGYFTTLVSIHPASPRVRYELARSLDNLAEEKKDNTYLRKAIAAYEKVLELGTRVPPKLFRIVGERCIDRLRFSGQYSGAEKVHKNLISRFSDEPRLRNQLAVTYLIQNKLSEARKVLQETLGRWPNDGFALVHYGFILKTGDGNMVDAIMYLKAGIETGDEGTIDGRFFFHLGDALVRLGRTEEAQKIYRSGAKNGLFLSVSQRSLYNVNHLTARPWWTLEETGYKEFFVTLENNWQIIRAEGLGALGKNGHFKNEAENLRDKGKWQQFELYVRGRQISAHCTKTPRTCSLIEGFPAAAGCRRGQIKFSVMYPGTHVWPHCGPTNCRLRAHLGLSGTEGTFIRVGNETRTWREGSVMIFDDSFEHEVWHNGTFTRLVLIVDVWHPELKESERHALPAI